MMILPDVLGQPLVGDPCDRAVDSPEQSIIGEVRSATDRGRGWQPREGSSAGQSHLTIIVLEGLRQSLGRILSGRLLKKRSQRIS